jgi:hypothetical protein
MKKIIALLFIMPLALFAGAGFGAVNSDPAVCKANYVKAKQACAQKAKSAKEARLLAKQKTEARCARYGNSAIKKRCLRELGKRSSRYSAKRCMHHPSRVYRSCLRKTKMNKRPAKGRRAPPGRRKSATTPPITKRPAVKRPAVKRPAKKRPCDALKAKQKAARAKYSTQRAACNRIRGRGQGSKRMACKTEARAVYNVARKAYINCMSRR